MPVATDESEVHQLERANREGEYYFNGLTDLGVWMACPDSVMKIESRFLDLLGETRQFGFSAGRLVLPYEKDSVSAALIFERAAPPDTVRAAPPSASGAGGK